MKGVLCSCAILNRVVSFFSLNFKCPIMNNHHIKNSHFSNYHSLFLFAIDLPDSFDILKCVC